MTEYGSVFDTNSIKQQLKEANRDYTGRKTWEGLYSSVDMAKQKQLNQLEIDYSKQMSEAYANAYNINSTIAASDLGQGYKLAAINDTDAALEEAYTSYRNNYLQAAAELEANAASAESAIDEALTQQAEYTKQFANKPYEYLQYLFDKYNSGSDEENIFANNELWKRYTYTDDDGNVQLKSWEDIKNVGAYDETTKEWTGMFDKNNVLTIKGAEFYDQMLNYVDSVEPGANSGFSQWLLENDSELYDWATTANPYDYTAAGSNLGSFKAMVGLESDDQKYSFIERFGGLTKTETDDLFAGFETAVNELDSASNTKSTISKYENVAKELQSLVKRLGIADKLDEDLQKSYNTSLEDIIDKTLEYKLDTKSGGERWAKGIGTVLSTTVAGTGIGAGVGVSVGGPVGAAIGTVIGASIGSVAGTTIALIEGIKILKQNKTNVANTKALYTNLVTALSKYKYEKQSEAQNKFNSKYR